MRLSIYAAAAVAVIAGATSLASRAEAFTAPAAPQVQSTEQVAYRTVCSQVWDQYRYRYVRQCRQVYYEPAPRYQPRYYAPPPPPRYYGGGGYGY